MVPDSFGNNTTSDGGKKKLLVTVAGVAAATALLLGFVFTATVAANTNNTAYAATDARGIEKKDIRRGVAQIEDPPYLVSFSQAAATVEKEFPDSKITSGERQYITIKTKSSPPRLPSPSAGSGGSNDTSPTTITPAYIFNLVKTDDKAVYHMTVVVNGTSGEIIPPKDISQNQIVNGNGCYITQNPNWPYPILVCPWGTYSGGPMPFIPAMVE
jgi:hypothetical protein